MLFHAAAQRQDGHERIVPAGRLPMSESYQGSTTLSKQGMWPYVIEIQQVTAWGGSAVPRAGS